MLHIIMIMSGNKQGSTHTRVVEVVLVVCPLTSRMVKNNSSYDAELPNNQTDKGRLVSKIINLPHSLTAGSLMTRNLLSLGLSYN